MEGVREQVNEGSGNLTIPWVVKREKICADQRETRTMTPLPKYLAASNTG